MNHINFNESEWIKLIFLLADTQQWLNDLSKTAMEALPLEKKQQLQRKTWHLSISAMAHILERHYYKIPRHPATGKFTVPVPVILHYIKEAASIALLPIAGCLNLQRLVRSAEPIGFDKNGESTRSITVISNPGGSIITAFPGLIEGIGPAILIGDTA